MRERELKPWVDAGGLAEQLVAPHAGARIETARAGSGALPRWSLPMRERELKRYFQTDTA